MAFMTQNLKAKLVKEVKKTLPAGVKVTFAVKNYSTIVATIRSSEFSFTGLLEGRSYYDVNTYHVNCDFYSGKLTKEERTLLSNIVTALNCENYDNSDLHRDYHEVGYYIQVEIGDYKKPYQQIVKKLEGKDLLNLFIKENKKQLDKYSSCYYSKYAIYKDFMKNLLDTGKIDQDTFNNMKVPEIVKTVN